MTKQIGYDGDFKPTVTVAVPDHANHIALGIPFNQERFDTDTMHDTTAPNLTGTVTKNVGSATLTGVNTLFLSELAIGENITVPGGANEIFIITAIASNTSLTLSYNAANTAGGQTATRDNSTRLYCKTAGKYLIIANAQFAANATGVRALYIRQGPGNNPTIIGAAAQQAIAGGVLTTQIQVSTIQDLAVNDFIILQGWQNSGGKLNISNAYQYSPEIVMVRLP